MRYNPLKDEWILVSPHRILRPWSGQKESVQTDKIPSFDPNNPLCPGVKRANGLVRFKINSTLFYDFLSRIDFFDFMSFFLFFYNFLDYSQL